MFSTLSYSVLEVLTLGLKYCFSPLPSNMVPQPLERVILVLVLKLCPASINHLGWSMERSTRVVDSLLAGQSLRTETELCQYYWQTNNIVEIGSCSLLVQ